jgi:hypothetical protein
MLVPYRNRAGNSGVTAYEILDAGIRVRFVDGEIYTYTVESAGREHVERMQELARAGEGLSGYIAMHVRHRYASKAAGSHGRRRPGRGNRAGKQQNQTLT